MTNTTQLQKARLIELNPDFTDKNPAGKVTIVQFNPETLKVTFANQVNQPSNSAGGATNTSTPASAQFVGTGTTKLALQLWFDVSGPVPEGGTAVSDVRELTKEVVYFMTPQGPDRDHLVPPAVRFLWGSFTFKGIFDSLDESLEFFSDQGVPLRASMSISMSQPSIQHLAPLSVNNPPPGVAGSPASGSGGVGTSPLVQAPAGASLQGLAASAGAGGNWQAIAEANGIENPRQLSPGQLINFRVKIGS
jgi:Contractile injection system tube protein/LysM domain